MLYLNISNIATITVKHVDYCPIIHDISKSEQFTCLKILCLKIVSTYKKYISILKFKPAVIVTILQSEN